MYERQQHRKSIFTASRRKSLRFDDDFAFEYDFIELINYSLAGAAATVASAAK